MLKAPIRTCLISREKLPKNLLLRIVRTVDKKIVIDYMQNIPGRGAYLKKDPQVVEKARQKRSLDRHLKTNVPDELYTQIMRDING